MKTLVFLFALLLGVGTLNAQTRTSIQLSELPRAISEDISTQHQGWTPQEAFKIDSQGVLTYEVVVKKASDEMRLVYDSNGKALSSAPKKISSSSGSTGGSSTGKSSSGSSSTGSTESKDGSESTN